MLTIRRHSYLMLPQHTGYPMRSDQLLRDMQKVVNHDLPNQLVVLQSLLQLLDSEESAHLGANGREYVRRLKHAAERAGDMVRFLKEIGRINTFKSIAEKVPLADLARELQGELQRLYPDTRFDFVWNWKTPAIVGDTRVFLQAMLELFAAFLAPSAQTSRVSAQSETLGDAIELAFLIEQTPADGQRSSPQGIEQRMEFILAREWLALCGSGAEVVEVGLSEGQTRFSIVVPDR